MHKWDKIEMMRKQASGKKPPLRSKKPELRIKNGRSICAIAGANDNHQFGQAKAHPELKAQP